MSARPAAVSRRFSLITISTLPLASSAAQASGMHLRSWMVTMGINGTFHVVGTLGTLWIGCPYWLGATPTKREKATLKALAEP